MADAGLPSRAARIVAVIGWVVFGGVVLRVVSGGGTLRGVGYVLDTEAPLLLVLIAASLVAGSVAVVALVRDVPWAWRASTAAAGVALLTSIVLGFDEHRSAALAAVASAAVLVMGIVAGRGRRPAR